MNITGLSNNYYLFKNKINIIVNGFTSDVKYLDLLFTNTNTTKTSSVRLYPINNVFKLNISESIKNTFNEPLFPNANINLNSVKIDFKAKLQNNTEVTQSITKYFIRGGNFQGVYADGTTQRENYLKDQDNLNYLISEKIPRWGTTGVFFNKINGGIYSFGDGQPIIEQFETPCKGIKLIFLNQYGTYSEWYFATFEKETATKTTDYLEKFDTNFNGNIGRDLGVKATSTITVKDLIPLRYNEIIRHLIDSPEVYVLEDGFRRKLIQKNRNWSFDSNEKMYEYRITFDYFDVFNPSELC
jgi:hypothetical protein